MTEAESYFRSLLETIPNVSAGAMFGALSMKLPNGKAAVMFKHDYLIVNLARDDREQLLSLDGTGPFDPSGARPMKDLIQIPFKYKAQWEHFAKLSIDNKLSN
ncbi:MAG: hypothetical protein ABIV51_02380 [Saprospiraceae bacterium]